MFSNKNKKRKATRIDTLVGHGTEIHGDLRFNGGLHIDGKVIGNIIAEADSGSVLSLSEYGAIDGDVRVPNIVINGQIVGDVYADGQVDLAEKARIKGSVFYRYIEMAKGSEVNGNLVPYEQSTSPVPQAIEERLEPEPLE